MTLRRALACAAGALGSAGAACDRSPEAPQRIVLYSSVDAYVLREAVAAFEERTGNRVVVVGDTESTKTTGLVQRLLTERDAPRADVWWSSEALGSVRLAEAGVLAALPPPELEPGVPWPDALRAPGGEWHGFGVRARVIAFNTERVEKADAPTSIADLTHPRWKGRVGLARPQFGTTRSHMAAICAADGPESLRAWVSALAAHDVRLYSGNAAAVRALAAGEIDLCLTDTDDVWSGQRLGWPVDLVYERRDADPPDAGMPAPRGPLVIPNTAGIVAGGPSPDGGRRLLEFILSAEVERLLAASDSRNVPVRPSLAGELPEYAIPEPWMPDWSDVAAHAEEAIEICEAVLGR
jgi:iron(III) transport system substrate-binding protein